MTLDELYAVDRRAREEGRADKDWAFTFVSDGPHGLPIRPQLLSWHDNDERVYAMTVQQLRKIIRLAEEHLLS